MGGPDDQEQSEKSASVEWKGSDNLRSIDAARHDRIANAREMLRARRLRSAIFGHKMWEPAWDMLVALYVSENRGKQSTTASLVMEVDVPASSAVRWIRYLESEGYVAESTGGGVALVRLLPKGRELLDAYFAALPRSPRGDE